MSKKIFGLVFIVAALWLTFNVDVLTLKKDTARGASKAKTPEEVQAIVNRHLQQTSKQIELQRGQLEVQLKRQLPQPGDNILPPSNLLESKDLGSIDGADRGQRRIQEPFTRERGRDLGNQPSQSVIGELAERERQAFEEEQARKAYILEFRRNAWLGGYNVVVDDFGNVISARPLTPAQKRQPFPQD